MKFLEGSGFSRGLGRCALTFVVWVRFFARCGRGLGRCALTFVVYRGALGVTAVHIVKRRVTALHQEKAWA